MKTRTTSIRLPEDLDEAVRKNAANQHVSFNELVNRVLTKYAEWDTHPEQFGMLATTREGLMSLIDAIPEDELKRISESFATSTTGELLNFWEGKSDVRSFISFLGLYSKYGGLGEFSVEEHDSLVTIHLHHQLGLKGSVVIAGWLGAFCERILGQEVQFSKGINSLWGKLSSKTEKD